MAKTKRKAKARKDAWLAPTVTVDGNGNEHLSPKAACVVIGGDKPISETTLWRLIKAGLISPPLKIGPQIRRFKRSTLLSDMDRMA